MSRLALILAVIILLAAGGSVWARPDPDDGGTSPLIDQEVGMASRFRPASSELIAGAILAASLVALITMGKRQRPAVEATEKPL